MLGAVVFRAHRSKLSFNTDEELGGVIGQAADASLSSWETDWTRLMARPPGA